MTAIPFGLRQADADVRDEALVFWRSLADHSDLDDLSDAARRLVVVAAVLFRRRGAVATSVRDITRAAGVSPGALYNHFESKEVLLYRLVQHGHDRVHRRLDECVDPQDDPVTQLQDFVRAYVIGHLEHQWLAQVVRREYLHLNGERLAAVIASRRSLRERLAAILRAGLEENQFTVLDPRRSVTPTAIMVLDLCTSTTEWYGQRHSGDLNELAELYVTAALRLVAATDRAAGSVIGSK